MIKEDTFLQQIKDFDSRRKIAILGNEASTIKFCVDHFLLIANAAIKDHGYFALALAGGSTPQKVYQALCQTPYREKIDWSKVFLFWGDERAVPHDHADSNYRMAMEAGFSQLAIPKNQIFPMNAAKDIEKGATAYEVLIKKYIPSQCFDLVLLGIGEDGHTASLFPHSKALNDKKKLVAANFVQEKNCWRMTLTFPCLLAARHCVVYAFGQSKAQIVSTILKSPLQIDYLPSQGLGSEINKVLWILDEEASKNL